MRKAKKLTRKDWARDPVLWKGRFEGIDLGTDLTVLFVSTDTVGDGPKLHTHPYDEVFIVRQGHVRYWVGDDVIDAGPGDVLLGPAEVPHKFENLGPGRLETTDIHLSPRWIQTDLE